MIGDQYWERVVLALHFDGANGSTSVIDAAGNAITAVNGASISTAQSKFGGASGLFTSASKAHLSTPFSSKFGLASGDHTIEFFFRVTDWYGSPRFFINGGYSISLTQGRLYIGSAEYPIGTSEYPNLSQLTPLNTWAHFALSVINNVGMVFANGNLAVTISNFSGTVSEQTSGTIYIGASPSLYGFGGYLDDYRITKGVGRYSATFTPPASAFATYAGQLSGTIKDEYAEPCSRVVRAYRRSNGALVGGTVSDPTTGAFTINTLSMDAHTVVALDDLTGIHYNAVVLDNILPG